MVLYPDPLVRSAGPRSPAAAPESDPLLGRHPLPGLPQVTVLKITVPPHTALAWHHHPMISAAYVLSGQLVV